MIILEHILLSFAFLTTFKYKSVQTKNGFLGVKKLKKNKVIPRGNHFDPHIHAKVNIQDFLQVFQGSGIGILRNEIYVHIEDVTGKSV